MKEVEAGDDVLDGLSTTGNMVTADNGVNKMSATVSKVAIRDGQRGECQLRCQQL